MSPRSAANSATSCCFRCSARHTCSSSTPLLHHQIYSWNRWFARTLTRHPPENGPFSQGPWRFRERRSLTVKSSQKYLKFEFHRSSVRRSSSLDKIGGPATDGTLRKAVFQPACFCIPLLRPHSHQRIPQRALPSDQVVYFFRNVIGVPVVDKDVLSKRTNEYRNWVEAFARNHKTPMEWAEKGVRKEEYVQAFLRRMERAGQY